MAPFLSRKALTAVVDLARIDMSREQLARARAMQELVEISDIIDAIKDEENLLE